MGGFLVLDNLAVRRGGFALRNVNLSLERNDYLVVLGPTGCGKTSLLGALAGFYPLAAGHLWLDGEDLGRTAIHRRRIGYVAQANDLFPHLSVEANIRFGLAFSSVERRDHAVVVARYLDLLGLRDLRHRRIDNLSGGEGKKVALARSLAVSPQLLLLDEPLGMLDPNSRQDVLETILKIHRELGTATIHVTHERAEARAVGGKCAVLGQGTLQQAGPVDEVFDRPANAFVAKFLGIRREGRR